MYIQKGDTVKLKGEVLAVVTKVTGESDELVLQVQFNKTEYTPDEVHLVRNMPNTT